MNPIYNFNTHTPPPLHEASLRAEQERRALQRQTALLAIAGILMLTLTLLLSTYLSVHFPALTLLCAGHLFVSLTGGSLVAFIYLKQGGSATCRLQTQ